MNTDDLKKTAAYEIGAAAKEYADALPSMIEGPLDERIAEAFAAGARWARENTTIEF